MTKIFLGHLLYQKNIEKIKYLVICKAGYHDTVFFHDTIFFFQNPIFHDQKQICKNKKKVFSSTDSKTTFLKIFYLSPKTIPQDKVKEQQLKGY